MIILLSGPDKKTGFSSEIKKVLNKKLRNSVSLVAIGAKDDYEKNDKYFYGSDGTLGVVKMFEQLDTSIKEYSLLDIRNTEEEMIETIKKSDIVFLMGGDPFVQIDLIKKIDYKELFKNKVLIGVSAGSMNLANKSYYSKDDDYPETLFYNGLGFTDITIDPHFDIENEEQVNEAKRMCLEHEIIGLPNSSGIIIDNDTVEYIGDYFVFNHKVKN